MIYNAHQYHGDSRTVNIGRSTVWSRIGRMRCVSSLMQRARFRLRPPWPQRRRWRLAHNTGQHECGAAARSTWAAFHVWARSSRRVRRRRHNLSVRSTMRVAASCTCAGESAAGHTALTPRTGASSAP